MAGLDLLLLDIDGVLIDARPSYDASIVETVALYLGRVLRFPGAEACRVTHEQIRALKRAGGFNNDWHASFALLRRVLARAPKELQLPGGLADGLDAAVERLGQVGPGSGVGCEALLRGAELTAFGEELAAAGGGLDAVSLVCGERHSDLVLYGDDLDRDDLVTRVFQEVYLGSDLLRQHHGVEPLLGEREGLWRRERPLVPREVLDRLVEAGPGIAVVTGRPRREAELALGRAGLEGHVAALGTEDDVALETARRRAAGVRPAHAGKPDPYLVRLVLDQLGVSSGTVVLVGDLADDMLAARAARGDGPRIEAVGATWGADDPASAAEALRQAGADQVLGEPAQLLELVEG